MTINNAQIKQKARQTLEGHWFEHCSFSVLLIVLELLCAGILNLFPDNGSLAAAVVILVAASILQALLGLFVTGASFHFLKCLRGEPSPLGDIVLPFKKQPDRYLIVELIEIAAGLLCYLPMMAAAYFMRSPALRLLLLLLFLIGGTAVYMVVKAAFVFSRFYLLEDNKLGAIASLKKSAAAMKGKKRSYVKLLLSFIGYLLLSLCTAGLGLIWVIPYFLTSQAEFYIDSAESTLASDSGTGSETFVSK